MEKELKATLNEQCRKQLEKTNELQIFLKSITDIEVLRKIMRRESVELTYCENIFDLFDIINKYRLNIFLFGKVPCDIPDEDIIYPKRATDGSAGYDIFSTETFTLKPGESRIIETGLNVLMNKDRVLMIFPRSGLGFKYKTQLANTVGIIDSDYILSDNYGHIKIKIFNDGDKEFAIEKGDAFAQAICMNYIISDDDYTQSKSIRNGGFNSTGKKVL